MTHLYLVRGLPGSGKTTLAGNLAGNSGAMFAADDFFEKDGVYRFNPSLLPQAHAHCQEQTRQHLSAFPYDRVVVHNTFVCRWEMEVYLRMANEHGARVTVVSMFDGGLTDDELFARNTHGVPLDAIKRMRANYEHDWKVGDIRPPWERG